jgi:prepilin-type N-terminal cleavage/methylation domain-containing protein
MVTFSRANSSMSVPLKLNSHAGFTLIEVLAALAVTVALAAATLPAARNLIFRWHAAGDVVDLAERDQRGLERIREDLSETIPVVTTAANGEVLMFATGPTCLTFIRRSLDDVIGLTLVDYMISSQKGEFQITRQTRPWSSTEVAPPNGSLMILRSADRLHFEVTGQVLKPTRGASIPPAMALVIGSGAAAPSVSFPIPARWPANLGKSEPRQLTCD